ncbi:MAG: GNAT family N-acetyltransferase, partial [Clostridia bacterium]|nr:GNAT family N-acetyltransferase [Clostridia bacterium]
LILRPLSMADAQAVFEWVSDERVAKYMIYPTYKNIEKVENWLESVQNDNSVYEFGFQRISDEKLIGAGNIRYDQNIDRWIFGYNLRFDCWGKGYATEATKAMIEFVRVKFNARKFASEHCEENIASGNVMKKCGLKFVGYGEFEKLDGSCRQRSMKYEGDF